MPIPNPPSYEHGSTGTEPGSSLDYENGDPLYADNLDYYIYTEFDKIASIIEALNEIDSGTIQVGSAATADSAASADSAELVKGNDIDSDGDGIVNMSDRTQSFEVRTDDPSSPDGRVWIRSDL